MKVSVLVGILLRSSLQVFLDCGDNSDRLVDKATGSLSSDELQWWDTELETDCHICTCCWYFHLLSWTSPLCHLLALQKKCQTFIYFFPLALVHCQTLLFGSSDTAVLKTLWWWSSFAWCFPFTMYTAICTVLVSSSILSVSSFSFQYLVKLWRRLF